MKTRWMILLLALFGSAARAQQSPQPPGGDEPPAPVLPSVTLKYTHLSYAGEAGNGRNTTAPLLPASNGYLYGIGYNRHASAGSITSDQSEIFRINTTTGGKEVLFTGGGPNDSVLNLLQLPNGDITGLANLGDYYTTCGASGCNVTAGRGITVLRIPATSPATVEFQADRFDSAAAAQLNALDQGSLVYNPVDGHVYGVGSFRTAYDYTSSPPTLLAVGKGPMLFRWRPEGGALEVIYRFNPDLADLAIGTERFQVGAILSLAVEPDTGRIAVMVTGDRVTIGESSSGSRIATAAGLYAGALLRFDPADIRATGELQPAYAFTKAEVTRFSTRAVSDNADGNGYLVDAGEGWWYGNAGGNGIGGQSLLGETSSQQDGGLIFRIRHDGTGFQVLHRFTNTCPAGTPAFVAPDTFLGLTSAEYEALSFQERINRSATLLFQNADCHRDWPDGKSVQGPLVKAVDEDGNTLIYGTAYKGGVSFWKTRDVRTGANLRYDNESGGAVFRLFTKYADEEGGGFQLVRPFRMPVGSNPEAAQPKGLMLAPDGRLMGLSGQILLGGYGISNSVQVAYTLELNAADIDITYDSIPNLLPNTPVTFSWWATRVTRCEAHSPSLAVWNGELPISGTRTVTPLQAGNHRLEIICQNDSGTVYLEKAFTLSVYSPPLSEDLYLRLFNYEQDNAGGIDFVLLLLMLLMLLVVLARRRSKPGS